MKLQLIGHNDLYAVEQLQMSLFSTREEGQAVSALYRGTTWLTAVTTITLGEQATRAVKRLRCADETVRNRRRMLQQCYYQAAVPHLPQAPAWGALSGVRPTKIVTASLLSGKTRREAGREMQQIYRVSPARTELALDCGVLFGGDAEIPLCEVEVEVKSGDEALAAQWAGKLAAEFGLSAEPESKFRRAFALAKGE